MAVKIIRKQLPQTEIDILVNNKMRDKIEQIRGEFYLNEMAEEFAKEGVEISSTEIENSIRQLIDHSKLSIGTISALITGGHPTKFTVTCKVQIK